MVPPHNDAERLAAVAEASEDAIFTTDLSGNVTSWNRAAEQIFGYEASEVMGRTARLLVPPAHHTQNDGALVARVHNGEIVDQFESVRVRKDGKAIAVSLTLSPIRGAHGEIVGVSTIARDLTDPSRVERAARRLAAIIESSDDAIASKDLNGIVTSWNRAAERMFGYSAAEMVGSSIRVIIPPDREAEEDEVLSRIRRGLKVDHFETVRQRKDGTLVPISLTVSPILGPDGTIIGASKIARDITERKRGEEERGVLLASVQENSRLKDEFLATLSHELRTPLNAILGYARMVRSGLIAADQEARAVETIERNATALTQIVEDVLDVSRIVAGRMRLNVQRVDLHHVVRDALDAVRPAADAKGVTLETLIDRAAVPISGDPDRLQQVVWNLLSNAVKFTRRGGRVLVQIDRAESHTDIIVSDTGVGIPPDFLPHIFERFRQADSGTTRERGGLGLGLAIARHLVEMHGGTIHAESGGEGAGSTFRVSLPQTVVRPSVPIEHPSHTPAVRGAQILVPALHGVRVLAVDDDADALRLVREILEAAHASVMTADSAIQAFALLEEHGADVLVADLGMPQTDGFELIGWIRQSPRHDINRLPAAALTAYARSEDRIRALRSGFHLHLAKPIDPGELMAAVASLSRSGNPRADR